MAADLKHRWSLRNNYLAGITADMWWKLLKDTGFAVDPEYWHRAAFITLASLLNSRARRKEETLHREEIEAVEIQPPVFILGHWRSGTTHLHNLLSRDPQFAFPNTYQVVNPLTFLTTEETNTRRFARMLPETRPMDAMELSFQSPQEDEFAPCLMTLRSLYLGISFPRLEDDYSRYLTFENLPEQEVREWKDALIWFLKKLTFKYGRQLVIKSPPHTARIRLLLEMFPEARFIHIHRHPSQVFQSCRHYYDTATWYSYLQRPDLSLVDDRIISRYRELHDAFFSQRELIPAGHFHEVGYDDLDASPLETVRSIYQKLELPGFDAFERSLRDYLGSLSGYRKNRFVALDPGIRDKIAVAWERSFAEWNYTP